MKRVLSVTVTATCDRHPSKDFSLRCRPHSITHQWQEEHRDTPAPAWQLEGFLMSLRLDVIICLACVWGSCKNDHSELSHQVQFSGKHLISCERQPSKQASRSFRLVSGEARRANGSRTKCLCGAQNYFLKMHFSFLFFLLNICSYCVAPSSCLFRPFVVQKLLKFTEAEGIISSIQCTYTLLSRQRGCGCPLCSTLVPSQQWISFVEERKSTTDVYFRSVDAQKLNQQDQIQEPLRSCPLPAHLQGHKLFEVTTILHASDMKDRFSALHSRTTIFT